MDERSGGQTNMTKSFIHQQMHYLLNLENSKIYIKLKLKFLLRVSVHDHHQGAYT
jgi:hypothetical protein